MKCRSCANLIPDNSVTCPYCSAPVEPVVSGISNTQPANNGNAGMVTNVINNQEVTPAPTAASVPETPGAPVLPQDQEMVVPPVAEAPVEAPVMPVATPTPAPVTPVVNEAFPTVETPVSEPTVTPVTPVEAQVQTPPVASAPVMANSMPVENNMGTVNVDAINSAPMSGPVVTPAQTPEAITNPVVADTMSLPTADMGEFGQKIGTAAPVKTKKKKNPLIFIILFVLLAIVGFGVFAYFYEFKSGDKRLETIVNGMFSFTNRVQSEVVTKASGSYTIDAKVNAGEQEFSTKMNGKYAYDWKNKIEDATLNIESLNLGTELLADDLNVELYLKDSKIYVLLQNFYDKYIFTEVEGLDKLFDSLSADINYRLILNTYKNAIANGLKATEYKQTVGDATINGKTEKANIITIVMNQNNQKLLTRAAYNTVINNTMVMNELSKLMGKDVATIKEEMKKEFESVEYEDSKSTIEFYTDLMGTKLIGIKIANNDDKKQVIEIEQVVGGAKIIAYENNKKLGDVTIKTTKKNTSTTKESTITIDTNFVVEKENYKANITIGNVQDLTPVVNEVNVKNSVNMANLTPEDMNKIITNISNFGPLGAMIKGFLAGMAPQTPQVVEPVTPNPVTP